MLNNSYTRTAIALFKQPNIKGTVMFTQSYGENYVHVDINLSSLVPYKKRAIHIHEYGDETNGCISLGAHWNPHNTQHGSISIPIYTRHAGDLINNIEPDKHGNFNYSYCDPLLNLFGEVGNTIIGRSVVVHDGEDDLGIGGLGVEKGEIVIVNEEIHKESKKTGNAGSRMACAIIGLANRTH